MSLQLNVPRMMRKDAMRISAKFAKLPRLEAQTQNEKSVMLNRRMTSGRTGEKQMKFETGPRWYGKRTEVANANQKPSHSEKQSAVYQSKEATAMSINNLYKSKPTIKYNWLFDSIITKSPYIESLGQKPILMHLFERLKPDDHSMISQVMIVPFYVTPGALPEKPTNPKEKTDESPKKTDSQSVEETVGLKKQPPGCLPPLSAPGSGGIGHGSLTPQRTLPLPSCPKNKKKKKPKKKC